MWIFEAVWAEVWINAKQNAQHWQDAVALNTTRVAAVNFGCTALEQPGRVGRLPKAFHAELWVPDGSWWFLEDPGGIVSRCFQLKFI
jgi:hypothetical protein